MKTKRNFKTAGFTLIELLVALTILSIGLAITVPAMRDFTDTNRQVEQINKLVRDITLAKSEAVTRGESFCVTSGPTGGPATPVWDGGWIVHNATTPLVPIRSATTVAIAGQVLASAGGFTSICFRPDGSVAPAFTVEQCKTACIPAANFPNEKQISVGVTGRISLNSRFPCPGALVCP